MGQVLRGSATPTEAIRRTMQRSEASVRALAQRHGISPTTVQKWRKREATADAAMGPKQAKSPVLTPEQEAMIVAFRRHTLLPLDDCLYALQLFLDAYNHARRLKALRSLTPYKFTCQTWTKEPDRLRVDPSHHTPGLNR